VTTSQDAFGRKKPNRVRASLKRIECEVRRVTRPLRDHIVNACYAHGDDRFLVLRHPAVLPSYYRKFLRWTGKNHPELRRRFELRLITQSIKDWSQYSLVIPWLPDTFMYRNQVARWQAADLVAQARNRGLPVINPPERLLATSKHDSAQRLIAAGVNAAKTIRITEPAGFRMENCGLNLPILIREDLAHGGWSPVFKINNQDELNRVPINQMELPIAVEFVDTRSKHDGLVRKYRYMAMGDIGISHTLQISDHWEVRSGVRKLTPATIAEELDYCDRPDSNHEIFQSARRALGLDFLAFDYSYDQRGRLIVWEINVLPGLGLPDGSNRAHLIRPLERAMAATLKLYLERAGQVVPQALESRIEIPVDHKRNSAAA
jgi:glutathione synthase/RimK-type ligase-like ATP-grasp enzyme